MDKCSMASLAFYTLLMNIFMQAVKHPQHQPGLPGIRYSFLNKIDKLLKLYTININHLLKILLCNSEILLASHLYLDYLDIQVLLLFFHVHSF